jgi:hypothetical protein
MLLLNYTKCSQDNRVVILCIGLGGAAARERAKRFDKGGKDNTWGKRLTPFSD